MEAIIRSIPREKLIKELTPERFIRKTNYGNNEVYIFTQQSSPMLMQEVGRLREMAFRLAGVVQGKRLILMKWTHGKIRMSN